MTNEQPVKRKWLRWVLGIGGGLLLLGIMAVAGLMLYFNDAYFKAKLQAVVKAEVGRDVEVRNLHVSIFGGSVTMEGVRLLNADESFKDKDTLRIERVAASVNLWPIITSSGKRIEGLRVEIEKPEIVVERRGAWPLDVGNIDDILKKLMSGPPGTWPKQTGLQALSGTITVRGGSALYCDSNARIGSSNIKNFDLDVTLGGLGQPTQMKTSLALATPRAEREGSVALDGRILWLQSDGSINPAAFQDVALNAQLKELDVAQIVRHLHIEARLSSGKFRGTLGKPITGTLKVEAPLLSNTKLTGTVETDGIVAIWADHKRVAGNIPAHADLDIQGGWSSGGFEAGTSRCALFLAPSRAELAAAPASRLLDLQVTTTAEGKGAAKYSIAFTTRMDGLFATDVGTVLGLKDRIGGTLEATVDASKQADGHMTAKGAVKTSQGYVMVGGTRQPTALDVGFTANVIPNSSGTPEKADVVFAANADSFYVRSVQPVAISSLNEPQKLAVQAKLKVHVGGREFWKQFGPLLEVANMSTPIEEEFDAELTASGSGGKVELKVEGALKQQTSSPTPLQLLASASYDGAALVDKPAAPYLLFDVKASTADKGLLVNVNGTATRGKDKQTIAVPQFVANGDLKAFTAFNARFGAYVSIFLGPKYTVAGTITQKGSSQFVQDFGPDGKIVGTTMTMTTDLALAKFELNGPSLAEKAPPLQWQENEATLQLGMVLKESGTASSLTIQPVRFKATGVTLDGEMAEADLSRLSAAAAPSLTPAKLWLEALPFTRLNVDVQADVLKRLQKLGVLPGDAASAGDLALKAELDPKTRKLKIETLSFQNPQLSIKLAPTQFDLALLAPALNDKTVSMAKLVPALPPLSLEANAKAEALQGMQIALGLPAEPLAPGAIAVRASYDPTTKRAAVQNLAFNGPDLTIAAAVPEVDVTALAAIADIPNATAAQWLQAAPSVTLDIVAKPSALERLQKLGMLKSLAASLGDATLAGALTLKGQYGQATDRLTLEKLEFQKEPASTLPLIALSATGEIAAVRALIAKPPADIPQLAAHLDKGLGITNLTVDANAVFNLLKQQKVAPEFVADALAGVYKPTGPIAVRNLLLKAGGAAGVFDATFELQAPLAYHPRSAPGQAPVAAAVAELAGSLKFDAAAPLRLTFGQNEMAAQGTLGLDAAGLRYVAHPKYFVYAKPAGTACKLTFAVTQSANAIRGSSAQLAGGPMGLSLANLVYNTTAPKTIMSLDKLVINMEMASGTLSGLQLDMNKDTLRLQFDSDALDLRKLAALGMQLPPHAELSGTIGKLQAQYAGAVSTFPGGLTATLANSNIVLAGKAPGQSVELALAADLSASPAVIGSKSVQATLTYTPATGAASTQKLQLPVEVTARKAGEGVLDALQKPGMPILVKVQNGQALTPLNVDALLDGLNALSAAWSPAPDSSSPSDMSGIKELRVELSATAPTVSVGGIALTDVKLTSVELDNLKATIKDAKASVYNGTATIQQENYDLVTQAHAGKFDLAGVNLQTATTDPAKPKGKDDYQILGKAGGSGELSGIGFGKPQMQTWRGAIKMQIDGLIAQKGEGKASGFDPMKMGTGILGKTLGSKDGIVGQAGRAMSIYGDDFGLFLNKLEFEPLNVSVTIAGGVASIARSGLVGKGKSAGLQLDFLGAVNISTNRFADDIKLMLIKLPPKTQESLRLNELDEKDRQTLLKEFEDGKFQPVILKGDVSNPSVNKTDVGTAFYNLDERINNLIQAKKGQTTPGTKTEPGQQPPPEKKKKGGLLDGLLNK